MTSSADLKKPIDLDLHCMLRQGISGFCRTRVKIKTAGLVATSLDLDLMPHSAISDLGLLYLLTSCPNNEGKYGLTTETYLYHEKSVLLAYVSSSQPQSEMLHLFSTENNLFVPLFYAPIFNEFGGTYRFWVIQLEGHVAFGSFVHLSCLLLSKIS